MRSELEEKHESGSFGLSRAVGRLDKAQVALLTKQQKSPRRIKFLQERLDRSWDVHTSKKAFAFVWAIRESGAGV